jgi:cytidylate kinase
VALIAQRNGVCWDDGPALAALIDSAQIGFQNDTSGTPRLFVEGQDLSSAIRTPEISMGASQVSRHSEVRTALLGLQRALGKAGGVVFEGRDIGTVVFPDAEVKVFLTASPQARAQRRYDELIARGVKADFNAVLQQQQQRDHQDQNRATSPLKAAEDAMIVDTTAMDIKAVIDHLVRIVQDRA